MVHFGLLAFFARNGSLTDVSFQGIEYLNTTGFSTDVCAVHLAGSAVCSVTYTRISEGLYHVNFTIGGSDRHGERLLLAIVNNSVSQGVGFTAFVVHPAPAVPVSPAIASIESSILTMQDQLRSIKSNLDSISSSFSGLQEFASSNQTASLKDVGAEINSLANSVSHLVSMSVPNPSTVTGQIVNPNQLGPSLSSTGIYLLVIAVILAATVAAEILIMVRRSRARRR